MRAILMFHKLAGTESQDSVQRPQLSKRKKSRSGSKPRSLSAEQPDALPLGQTGSHGAREYEHGLNTSLISSV